MAKIKVQKENIKNNFNGDLSIEDAIFRTILTKLYSELDNIEINLKNLEVNKIA